MAKSTRPCVVKEGEGRAVSPLYPSNFAATFCMPRRLSHWLS